MLILSKKHVWTMLEKESRMQQFVLLLLVLVIIIGVMGYKTYQNHAERRAREKKRNQYHDRV